MNHTHILGQAWNTLIRYRALWVFGVILALCTASAASVLTWMPDRDQSSYANRGITIQPRDGESFWDAVERTVGAEIERANDDLDRLFDELSIPVESDIVAFLITLAAIAVALGVIRLIGRYLSRTALIRMVDRYQATGQKQSVREGFRLGWSRQTWQLFFIELLINVVTLAAVLLLFALVFGPLPLWVDGRESTIFAFSILTAAFFFLAIFLAILAGVFASIVKRFARRVCVVEELGITASVYRGYRLARQNLRELLPLVVVMVGINLSWPFVAGISMLLLFGAGLLVGGLPGLITGNLLALVTTGSTPVVVGAVLGSLILFLVLTAPLVWLDGMRQIFLSTLWTLAYRQLEGREVAPQSAAPEPPVLSPPPSAQGASGLAR